MRFVFGGYRLTVLYMGCGVFVCEDFPKENQKLANEQLTLV